MNAFFVLVFILGGALTIGRGLDLALWTSWETGLCLTGSVWLRYAALAAAVLGALLAGYRLARRPDILRSECRHSGRTAALASALFVLGGVLRLLFGLTGPGAAVRAVLELVCGVWFASLARSWMRSGEYRLPNRSMAAAVLGTAVFYWAVLSRFMENMGRFENDKVVFDIMLPSRNQHLDRGKKAAIGNMLKGVGRDMIACVDADYDYILQGETELSRQMLENPYIFHTYAYAIENFQCYAKGLHETCVMVTLNDHDIFDFNEFLDAYSQTIWPLFVWHIAFVHRRKMTVHFDMSEFNKVVVLPSVRIQDPHWAIEYLAKKVRAKIFQLQRRFPKIKEVLPEEANRLRALGIHEHNTYLYIQGHHLFDLVVSPIVESVCNALRNERENEIRDRAIHSEQARTEMACYENSLGKVKMMMKKNTFYQFSPEFQKIQADVEKFLSEE